MPSPLTIIFPFYLQPRMLALQLAEWENYPQDVQVILVDDGSSEPAEPIVLEHASYALLRHLRLYRITVDVPWARGTARNLGATEAQTPYILHTDLDHVLPASCVPALLAFVQDGDMWYRLPRYRRGKADATRRKDDLPPEAEFGLIKPHNDSYLIQRDLFLSSPYDEDYNGCLGGGTPFLHRMEKRAQVGMVPDPICLHVYTRSLVSDASIQGLSRDTSEYVRRRKEKERTGNTEPTHIIRLPWKRVL